jgi:hypothetical protein
MRTLRLKSLFLTVVLVGASGAAQSQKPSSTSKPVFSAKIFAVHDIVTAGSEVSLIVTLTNTSDHQIAISEVPVRDQTFIECYDRISQKLLQCYKIEIRDERRNLVPEIKPKPFEPVIDANGSITIDLHLGRSIERYLKPGEAVKDELVVSNRYDLSQPGKYTIKVQRIDTETMATVESNTITMTVTP